MLDVFGFLVFSLLWIYIGFLDFVCLVCYYVFERYFVFRLFAFCGVFVW